MRPLRGVRARWWRFKRAVRRELRQAHEDYVTMLMRSGK